MVIDFLISLLQDFQDANVHTETTAISALAFFVCAPAGLIIPWYNRGLTRLRGGNDELRRECRERRRAEEQLRRHVEGLQPQTIPGLAERVEVHRAAHDAFVEVLGEQHPRTLDAAADLGLSLAASGDAGGRKLC